MNTNYVCKHCNGFINNTLLPDFCPFCGDVNFYSWEVWQDIKRFGLSTKSKRQTILETALNLTIGDRNKTYGDPFDNMKILKEFIHTYLSIDRIQDINEVDIAIIMCLVKISRITVNKNHEDNYIDLAAYAAIAGECAQKLQENLKNED